MSESDIYGTRAGTIKPTDCDLLDPEWVFIPRYWVSRSDIENRTPDAWRHEWFIGFRNAISAVADARSVAFTIFPRWGAGNSLPLLFSNSLPVFICLLVANFNAFILDYAAKQKASGGNLNYYIVKQLPILPADIYLQTCIWLDNRKSVRDFLFPRMLELTYTAWNLESFAHDCKYNDPPFRWNEERRFILRCELDAAFFHLYLVSRHVSNVG